MYTLIARYLVLKDGRFHPITCRMLGAPQSDPQLLASQGTAMAKSWIDDRSTFDGPTGCDMVHIGVVTVDDVPRVATDGWERVKPAAYVGNAQVTASAITPMYSLRNALQTTAAT